MTTSIDVQWDRDAVLLLEFETSGYTDAVAGDIGKTVTADPSTDTGELLAYDNTNRKWWVKPDASTDTFPDGDSVMIGSGTGAGTLDEAGVSKYWLKTTLSNHQPPASFQSELMLMEYKDPGGDIYLHITTLGDVFNYGTTAAAAGDYYRVATANQFFDSPEDVMTAQDLQETRLQNLVNDWENYYAEFDPGTESKTIADTV